MKNEYEHLKEEIEKGNIKDYEKALGETSGKIEEYKFDLENKINNEIPNFRKKLLLQLNFIVEKLEKIWINKGNLNSFDLFRSIYEAKEKAVEIVGKTSFSIFLGLARISAATEVAAHIASVAMGPAVSEIFFLSSFVSLGIGAIIAVSIPLAIRGGFALYKKLVEKSRYIELISNAKIELEKSLSIYENNINSILRKITDEIEMAVKKFFTIQNVKLDGIKKHMDDWLELRKQIIKCLEN